MNAMAKVEQITIPSDKRVICVSDIHGNLDLFKRLLDKVNFSDEDILVVLGDFYSKGKQNIETFKFVIDLCQKPDSNVYAVRGNCDFIESYMDDSEKEWIENLPHIIETQDYIFVHAGLTSNKLDKLNEQEAQTCMKNDAFMEQGLSFDKYIVTGHWPTVNYCHRIPCCNPIVDEKNYIISIDGGMSIKADGQLNAFIIFNDTFSFDFVDNLPVYRAEKAQSARGGELNITWNDRFIEPVEKEDEFGIYRHIQSGMTLSLPNSVVWTDYDGRLCDGTFGTDYYVQVDVGDVISVIKKFGNKIFAKKGGVMGWVEI
ncbi:MAG: metallophosphoesterase [Oscillospiraceae bacterium]|nr:metallophosphoesterase [Oscillospiraceae bacterium]